LNPFQALRAIEPHRALRAAVGLWVLFALIVGIIVASRPDKRTVTPEYRQASEKWWAGKESPYDMSQVGYLYLPQEAILYTPYQVLPKRIGEPLWRWTGLALLAAGLWRVAGLMSFGERSRLFLASTILVIPAALSSARNGQVNLPLAGLMLLTVADLARGRWNTTTLWLLLAIMLKPIALAPALLATACYGPLRLRLAGGLLLCLAVAWIHPDPAYVTAEYRHFWQKFLLAGQPANNTFSDFFGMLWYWGFHPAPAVISGIRALAAMVTLGLSLYVMRRFRGDALLQAFGVMLLSALYLMLFNPRTEENSYVMLAGFTALMAGRAILAGAGRTALLLTLFTLALAVECYGYPIFPLTKIWFKPLATLGFAVSLVAGGFSLLKSPARDVRTAG
jgi:hypothetical protein